MNGWRIEELGEAALLLRFGDSIDAASTERVHTCAAMFRKKSPSWLVDVTPAYASLALHLDIAHIENAGRNSDAAIEVARTWIENCLASFEDDTDTIDPRTVEIPVVYGNAYGPDLATLAGHTGLSIEEVVARHTAVDYTVAMIGFAPGFPYLLGLDPSLAMPRHATPRIDVTAGSVGIGGGQTGIYPNQGPGGWQVIGRTPLQLFDATRDQPSLLQVGDCVRFVAIDAASFDSLSVHSR